MNKNNTCWIYLVNPKTNMNVFMDKITSFKDIEKLVEGRELPISGETEDGEFIMICKGRAEEGLGRSYQVATEQDNGWTRIHTYWEDGTKEETFKRNNN